MRSKYAESNAVLYQDFLSSIEIPGSMVRTRAIQDTFTDAVNGKPIRRVRVSSNGQNPQVKGGEKGGYFISSLSPGMHEIAFSRSAYITVVKKLVILPDQAIVLDIAFTPVQIEEASMFWLIVNENAFADYMF
ncbi:carboxypeptidase-like regulatory domain-containing protein [Ancylomarina longa]|uniref:Carboxypeptidase regulatory-like domain-containing protein n=1 Tax=Ancylomarina longa TaxID=2487017 RepID=A0A434AFD7_9BACT|nr:carboxypeptidase-like regulatory domain-containing protein [Ancylomarina longa]RUT73035.1 carboxypeptidase regulatory-like domain-containing protein [Ancylomarina longa]